MQFYFITGRSTLLFHGKNPVETTVHVNFLSIRKAVTQLRNSQHILPQLHRKGSTYEKPTLSPGLNHLIIIGLFTILPFTFTQNNHHFVFHNEKNVLHTTFEGENSYHSLDFDSLRVLSYVLVYTYLLCHQNGKSCRLKFCCDCIFSKRIIQSNRIWKINDLK